MHSWVRLMCVFLSCCLFLVSWSQKGNHPTVTSVQQILSDGRGSGNNQVSKEKLENARKPSEAASVPK